MTSSESSSESSSRPRPQCRWLRAPHSTGRSEALHQGGARGLGVGVQRLWAAVGRLGKADDGWAVGIRPGGVHALRGGGSGPPLAHQVRISPTWVCVGAGGGGKDREIEREREREVPPPADSNNVRDVLCCVERGGEGGAGSQRRRHSARGVSGVRWGGRRSFRSLEGGKAEFVLHGGGGRRAQTPNARALTGARSLYITLDLGFRVQGLSREKRLPGNRHIHASQPPNP